MYFIALQGPRTHNFIVHVWCTVFASVVLRVRVLNTGLAIYSNTMRINQTLVTAARQYWPSKSQSMKTNFADKKLVSRHDCISSSKIVRTSCARGPIYDFRSNMIGPSVGFVLNCFYTKYTCLTYETYAYANVFQFKKKTRLSAVVLLLAAYSALIKIER